LSLLRSIEPVVTYVVRLAQTPEAC
jgi:hypothetical protein